MEPYISVGSVHNGMVEAAYDQQEFVAKIMNTVEGVKGISRPLTEEELQELKGLMESFISKVMHKSYEVEMMIKFLDNGRRVHETIDEVKESILEKKLSLDNA